MNFLQKFKVVKLINHLLNIHYEEITIKESLIKSPEPKVRKNIFYSDLDQFFGFGETNFLSLISCKM